MAKFKFKSYKLQLTCLFCRKIFTTQANFEQHINFHTGERPYQCLVCSKDFAYLPAIWIHCRQMHGGRGYQTRIQHRNKPYQCSECPAKYSRLSGLWTHFTKKHGVYKGSRSLNKIFKKCVPKNNMCDPRKKHFTRKSQMQNRTSVTKKQSGVGTNNFPSFAEMYQDQLVLPKCFVRLERLPKQPPIMVELTNSYNHHDDLVDDDDIVIICQSPAAGNEDPNVTLIEISDDEPEQSETFLPIHNPSTMQLNRNSNIETSPKITREVEPELNTTVCEGTGWTLNSRFRNWFNTKKTSTIKSSQPEPVNGRNVGQISVDPNEVPILAKPQLETSAEISPIRSQDTRELGETNFKKPSVRSAETAFPNHIQHLQKTWTFKPRFRPYFNTREPTQGKLSLPNNMHPCLFCKTMFDNQDELVWHVKDSHRIRWHVFRTTFQSQLA